MFLRIFCLLVLLLSIEESNAQKIHITDTGNVWEILNGGGGTLQDAYENVFYYGIGGDTIINNREYKKIVIDSSWTWDYASQGLPIHFVTSGYSGLAHPHGLIREDTLNGRVFARSSNDTTETLLYDYSLQIGDTFLNWQARYSVTNMDSVMINNIAHKRWTFTKIDGQSGVQTYKVIEGVGSTKGLFNYNTFETMWATKCFSNFNISQSSESFIQGSPCSMTLAVHEVPKQNESVLVVRPNPIQREAVISFPYLISNGLINIYDILGKLIFSQSFTAREQVKIINTFRSGTYLVEIRDMDNHKCLHQRFVSQ